MTVDEAIAIILGPELADSISLDMGQHWAIVAAMARATTDQDPEAIRTLQEYIKAQK